MPRSPHCDTMKRSKKKTESIYNNEEKHIEHHGTGTGSVVLVESTPEYISDSDTISPQNSQPSSQV